MLYANICTISVSTSHCTVCCFCATVSTAVFYTSSNVSQYHTMYRLLVLCHYVHLRLLHYVKRLSVTHIVPSVGLCYCVHCCLLRYVQCLSVAQTVQSVVPVHHVRCCLLQYVHCLSVTHDKPPVFSASICPLLISTVFLLSCQ